MWSLGLSAPRERRLVLLLRTNPAMNGRTEFQLYWLLTRPKKRVMKKNPKPYEWDWHGQCDPAGCPGIRVETFSVGCFQWIPRTGVRPGLKKGKVVQRFAGPISNPKDVYKRAQAWCDAKNQTTPLLPCPVCGKPVDVVAAEHGGHFIKCPPRGRAHTHVSGVTPADLRERWIAHVARSTDPRVKP